MCSTVHNYNNRVSYRGGWGGGAGIPPTPKFGIRYFISSSFPAFLGPQKQPQSIPPCPPREALLCTYHFPHPTKKSCMKPCISYHFPPSPPPPHTHTHTHTHSQESLFLQSRGSMSPPMLTAKPWEGVVRSTPPRGREEEETWRR